jgi:hypothetical protein
MTSDGVTASGANWHAGVRRLDRHDAAVRHQASVAAAVDELLFHEEIGYSARIQRAEAYWRGMPA